jgi:hypothetical protein
MNDEFNPLRQRIEAEKDKALAAFDGERFARSVHVRIAENQVNRNLETVFSFRSRILAAATTLVITAVALLWFGRQSQELLLKSNLTRVLQSQGFFAAKLITPTPVITSQTADLQWAVKAVIYRARSGAISDVSLAHHIKRVIAVAHGGPPPASGPGDWLAPSSAELAQKIARLCDLMSSGRTFNQQL